MMKRKKKFKDKVSAFRTNLDKVREHYSKFSTDSRWWKPRPGKHIIRVLPPWGPSADGMFYYAGGLHYGFKIGGRDRAIACPDVVGRGACPVCAFVEALRESGDEDHEELLNRLRVKRKYWVNLIDRRDPEKVLMYGGGKKLIDAILEAMEDDDLGDVTDPEEGHDIKVSRTGSGMYDTRYTFTVRPRPSSLDCPDWSKKVHKLDKVVLDWMPFDEMASHLRKNFGDVMEDIGFRVKTKKAEKIKSKKRRVEEPEDEDEEDEEGED